MGDDNRAIRIFIVEDDDAMRMEFERMALAQLDVALELQGSAGSLGEAYQMLGSQAPDVAIVDLGLPDGDGSALIASLRDTSPGTAVLVATVFGDEAHVIRAIEAGARGYLLKDSPPQEFVQAIRMVHEGGAPLSPQIARHLLKRFAPASPTLLGNKKEHDSLTVREIDILTRISQGFSITEVARSMDISHHTVGTHVKNIYSKLAVHNRVEAVNQARSKGLIR